MPSFSISRRNLLASAVVGSAGAAFLPAMSASAETNAKSPEQFRLTVLGTTDTHGNILNWDYFKDAEYDDAQHNDVGLAKIATLVNAMRAERPTLFRRSPFAPITMGFCPSRSTQMAASTAS